MNSLEYIEKLIKMQKENIDYHKNLLKDNSEYAKEINSAIKFLEPELQTLQQIKTVLEAWEVCITDNSILYVIQALAEGESIDWHRLPEEKQEILKINTLHNRRRVFASVFSIFYEKNIFLL